MQTALLKLFRGILECCANINFGTTFIILSLRSRIDSSMVLMYTLDPKRMALKSNAYVTESQPQVTTYRKLTDLQTSTVMQ